MMWHVVVLASVSTNMTVTTAMSALTAAVHGVPPVSGNGTGFDASSATFTVVHTGKACYCPPSSGCLLQDRGDISPKETCFDMCAAGESGFGSCEFVAVNTANTAIKCYFYSSCDDTVEDVSSTVYSIGLNGPTSSPTADDTGGENTLLPSPVPTSYIPWEFFMCTRPDGSEEFLITYPIAENTLYECAKACEEAPPYNPPLVVSHCPTSVSPQDCDTGSNMLGRVIVTKCSWVSLTSDNVCTDQSMFVYNNPATLFDRGVSCKTTMGIRGVSVAYNWLATTTMQTAQIAGSTIPSLQPLTPPLDPPSTLINPAGMCNDTTIEIARGVLDKNACDKLVRDQTPVGTIAYFSYNRSGGICFNAANKYTAALCGPQWVALNDYTRDAIHSSSGNAGPSSAPTTKAPSAGPSSAPTTKAPSAGPSSAPTTHAPSKAPSSSPTPSNSNPPLPPPTKSSDGDHRLRHILIPIGVGTAVIGIVVGYTLWKSCKE